MTTLTATGSIASAHPPTATEHGVNATTIHRLWSGDLDGVSNDTNANWTAMRTLAAGTDVPLDAPPAEVERWNRGELGEFPKTDPDRSIHPPNASLEDGVYLKDAYVEIAAVQPSTRAYLDPGAAPLYVGADGTVLGTVDYRVALPADDTTGDRRETWRLHDHRIVETRLEIDGAVERRDGGTHTPDLTFTDIGGYPGDVHELALVAVIEVTLERTVRTGTRRCRTVDGTRTCRTVWTETVTFPVESLTVEDAVEVTEYDLDVGGYRTRYPDGDLGLVVFKDRPWLGYTLPTGDVRGVWRFYAARDSSWDTLLTSTEDGSTSAHSPIHPLQVAAYPFEPGPTVSPRENVTLLGAYGTTTDPPSLPADVHLDVLTEPYVASYGIATRFESPEHDPSGLTAFGLVRGVEVSGREADFVEVPVNRSRLSASVVNLTEETVTVEVQLADAETGEPIFTGWRGGYVLIGEERVDTGRDGRVVRTLSRPPGGVPVRFVPGQWWLNDPGYVGDATVVTVRGPVMATISTVYRAGVPVGLFLLAVFIVDRFTGWALWPPWRGW